jgi:predicted AlkP superfamily pyrophosphatase or phosphodiesterase
MTLHGNRRATRTLLVLLVAIGCLVLVLIAVVNTPGPGRGRHVLVISIDGMSSSYYTEPPPGLKIPNLRRLMTEGSFAEAVEGVYPTVTYPSHATIVTGRMPAEHGIYTNLSSRQAGLNSQDWFWFAKSIRARTLWDEARAHHLTTASVAWPVTVGAAIDWDVPEIWNPALGEHADAFYVAHFMNPLTALQVVLALGLPKPGSEDDGNRTRIASYLLAAHRPNLTLVHLEALDLNQHEDGPRSTQANAALSRADTHVGELLATIKQAGMEKSTDVFIVSDHGFLPVERDIHPNVLLVKAGLLTADAKGKVAGGRVVTVPNGGSFFIYWPGCSPDIRAQVEAALKPLQEDGLLFATLGPQDLREMKADPEACLALDAAPGDEFAEAGRGNSVTVLGKLKGDHGYLPSRPGLECSFIAWGPDINSGVDLHRIDLTEVGPTILEAMGILDPSFGDKPPLQAIFK